jgi:tetratricopeptide (TPR) repeat protein
LKAERRHDLRHDELADALGLFWERVVHYRVQVTLGVVGVAVLAGLVALFVSTALGARAAANDRLAAAQKDTMWIDMLRQQDPEGASQRARKAVEELRALAQEAPQQSVAARAMLRAGQILYSEKKVEEAIEAFRQAMDKASGYPELQQFARQGLAVALEQAGRYAEAIQQYRVLGDSENPLVKAQSLWDIGRCCELMNDRQQALQSYARTVEAAGNSRWAELAADRARVLTVEKEEAEKGLTSGGKDAMPLDRKEAPGKPSEAAAGQGGPAIKVEVKPPAEATPAPKPDEKPEAKTPAAAEPPKEGAAGAPTPAK